MKGPAAIETCKDRRLVATPPLSAPAIVCGAPAAMSFLEENWRQRAQEGEGSAERLGPGPMQQSTECRGAGAADQAAGER